MSTKSMQSGGTLVIGGRGKTGRRVVERLTARGLPVRIGSSVGTPPFTWADKSSWAPVLRDTEAVYLNYHPHVGMRRASSDVVAFTELAVRSGVRKLVLLSARGEPAARRVEQAVEYLLTDTSVEFTVLRAAWFDQNFNETGFMAGQVADGDVAVPADVDGVPEPFVDVEDIADVAVEALTTDGHHGRKYDITGPRLLTHAEAIAEIAEFSGRDIRYRPVPMPEFSSALLGRGMLAEKVELLTYLLSEPWDGRNSHVSDDVERVLGRGARDFGSYVRDVASEWNVRAEPSVG